MASDASRNRHSKAESAELIEDPQDRANREARNALRQFDVAQKVIDEFVREPERPFRLRPSLIMQLHHTALEGLSEFAGRYRPAGVAIEGSKHSPPGGHLVPELVETMCDYVNENWNTGTPLHLAAYVMWRLNWIHPFDDGNGRTSRMVAHVVLCIKLGHQLPGRYTIPEQIAENRNPYYGALEAADAALVSGQQSVGALEQLIESMLARQLVGIYQGATRNSGDPIAAAPKFH
jgi:Fic family protein